MTCRKQYASEQRAITIQVSKIFGAGSGENNSDLNTYRCVWFCLMNHWSYKISEFGSKSIPNDLDPEACLDVLLLRLDIVLRHPGSARLHVLSHGHLCHRSVKLTGYCSRFDWIIARHYKLEFNWIQGYCTEVTVLQIYGTGTRKRQISRPIKLQSKEQMR